MYDFKAHEPYSRNSEKKTAVESLKQKLRPEYVHVKPEPSCDEEE